MDRMYIIHSIVNIVYTIIYMYSIVSIWDGEKNLEQLTFRKLFQLVKDVSFPPIKDTNVLHFCEMHG